MKKKADPFISVIIPLRQLSYYLIFESLPAFSEQTYKNFEVIVLPNEQTQYDLTLLRKYKFLRIIPTGKITRPAEKRDIGVKNATGEIIAFIDDDAYPSINWLERAVKLFDKQKVAAVCGPGSLPKISEYWEKASDEVLKTWVGAGGNSYRFIPRGRRYVDDYPSMNFLIRKKWFDELGGFNSDYWPGEDSKLCNDLVYKANQKILYDPKVEVFHHRRKELQPYLKQHANYGFHRGAFFAHGDRNSRRISYAMPTLFMLYVIFYLLILFISLFVAISSIFLYIFSLPVIYYLASALYIFTKSLINTSDIKVGFGAVTMLFLTHFIYATMFIKGFYKGLNKIASIYDKR